MTKASNPQFLLFSLIVVDFCSGADIQISVRPGGPSMNWEAGRQRCQDDAVDLASMGPVRVRQIASALNGNTLTGRVWVGLHRDPESDNAWRWIDRRTGKGLTGSDFSNNSHWTAGSQNPHCAVVGAQSLAWHSELSSTPHPFYCSSENNITLFEEKYSWDVAQIICASHSMTLATVDLTNTHQFNKTGWIGLCRVDKDTWKWSDGSPFGYTNWAPGEPSTRDCGLFNATSHKLESGDCSQELRPLCLLDNLMVVKLNKTWEEAVAHCRELQMTCTETSCVASLDLVTPQLEKHNSYLGDRMYREGTSDEVWVGLRFLAGQWFGLHGEPIRDLAALPDSPAQQHCGSVDKYNYKGLMLRDCSERKNFICYKKAIEDD